MRMPESSAPDFIRHYMTRMAEIRGTGGATKETSYYSALENLLNNFGSTLRPQVISNGQLRNQGANNPDFGLYVRSQIQGGEPRSGQLPERGVIEVKGLGDNTWVTAKSEQVTKYFGHYRLVLVTNYREFRLIGDNGSGSPVELDRYTLAPDEASFWSMAAKPIASAQRHTVRFSEFLKRVLMIAAPLVRPEDIAWFIASYAREALQTLEEKASTALDPLRSSLETALDIRFEGPEGDHFFKSTLVQTLFYGMFSAWVVHARSSTSRFDWKSAAFTLTVPMVKVLFEEIAKPSRMAALDLMPVMERAADALNRVDKTAFFKSFDYGDAVQHFYEPFLQAYDPELRKSLGVWYTPREIVQYMVERVDQTLRTELGRPNGLADKDVYVLDPCCGTGAYVVEVLRKIERTLRDQGADDLLADDLKQAARDRIFGFEIMSAPYVVAHWQVGNYLAQLGAPLNPKKGERAAVYLTNSLQGWEPPQGPKANVPLFPELEVERDAAEHVKRNVPILVVLGNPPYNAYAGTSPEQEQGLVDPYKSGLIKEWGIKKFNLDELYVRFMRVAQRRIAEGTKQGIVCYISSFSYLSDPSFVVMRKRLLEDFDKISIDCLNGDSRETGKKTPDGKPDPSVFSTKYNTAGIRLGTSVGLFVRKLDHQPSQTVAYRDFWGANKRQDLFGTVSEGGVDVPYTEAVPAKHNRFSFRPHKFSASFQAWPRLVDLCASAPIAGLQEMRFGSLMAIERTSLAADISRYLDPNQNWAQVRAARSGPIKDAGGFKAETARQKLLGKETFQDANIRRYSLYPLDNRWAYWSATPTLWNRARPQLVANAFPGNKFFVARMKAERPDEGVPAAVTTSPPDYHLLRPNVVAIPFVIQQHGDGFFAADRKANLSPRAKEYLKALGFPSTADEFFAAELVWMHALAICFSPLYLAEHKDEVLGDWPRVPMPNSKSALETSAALGAKLAGLLDPDVAVPGVTDGKIDPRLLPLGMLSRTDSKSLTLADLSLTAGWGHRTTKGVIMPGGGRTQAHSGYGAGELAAISEDVAQRLGPPLDVMLNDVAMWRCVPRNVWEYRVGGYQVIKKWLSYREQDILGRPLTKEEARDVTGMVRRVSALILMSEELNASYGAARDSSVKW